MKRWCVAWRHYLTGKTMYCATYRGRRPSMDARNDDTACGATVYFRIGDAKRTPTCPDCKAKIKERKRRGRKR